MDRNRHMATRTADPSDFVHKDAPAILETFPAGAPRGSWPAEEFAEARRLEGQPAEVVMNLADDSFLVILKAVA
jgi:hypothetical protein